MALSQVIEENGVKKLAPMPGATNVGAAEAMAVAAEAKATAEAALPKAGGEMTGPVSNFKLSGLAANIYDASAVSSKWVKDYAPRKTGNSSVLWVNELTGSDTANLMEGRGFSQDMPFLTLVAAAAWASAHMSGSAVTINLDSDINLPSGLNVVCPNLGTLIISADTHTINLGAPISVSYGKLNIKRGKFVAASSMRCFMYAAGLAGCNPVLSLEHTIELQGTVTEAAIMAAYGGTVIMYTGSELTGNVTGKRYSALNCGRILVGGRGAEAIPGTEAGICDASSIYA